MSSRRATPCQAVPAGGSPWWLAAAAGPALGLFALATGIGLLAPVPRGSVAEHAARRADLRRELADPRTRESGAAVAAEEHALAEDAWIVVREELPMGGAPRGAAADPPRAGSERWHVERLRALAAGDLAAFTREARARADVAGVGEQFALLRVALEREAPVAAEVGRALLASARRDDGDRLLAAVAMLERFAMRANVAAAALLDTLSVDEAQRLRGRRRVGQSG